jgi:hypothetical protein
MIIESTSSDQDQAKVIRDHNAALHTTLEMHDAAAAPANSIVDGWWYEFCTGKAGEEFRLAPSQI